MMQIWYSFLGFFESENLNQVQIWSQINLIVIQLLKEECDSSSGYQMFVINPVNNRNRDENEKKKKKVEFKKVEEIDLIKNNNKK